MLAVKKMAPTPPSLFQLFLDLTGLQNSLDMDWPPLMVEERRPLLSFFPPSPLLGFHRKLDFLYVVVLRAKKKDVFVTYVLQQLRKNFV